MIDEKGLARLLALHEKTYGLFTWLNTSLKSGRSRFTSVGEALTFSDAAAAWVRQNAAGFPEEFRPEGGDVEEFAHLFVSYVATSFEVVDSALYPSCRYCWCCGFWKAGKHLRLRNPSRKARGEAAALKRLYLGVLAEEAGLPLLDPDLDAFVKANRDLAPALSLATYARELLRRSMFASQGEGVLALWREIAWDERGRPKAKFRLEAKKIVEAEAAIRKRLEALAA